MNEAMDPSWPLNLNLSDPYVTAETIATWKLNHQEGRDRDFFALLMLVNAINQTQPERLPALFTALGENLSTQKLTQDGAEMLAYLARDETLSANNTQSLLDAAKKGGGHPKHFLVNSIRAALISPNEERLAALDVVVRRAGANEVIILEHGSGNVLYHAINLAHRLHVSTFENLEPVLEVMVRGGANVYSPSEDIVGHMGMGHHPSLLDWLGGAPASAQWWAERSLNMLLDLGCGWGSLDQRDDPAGRLVLNHPAWRKQHLGAGSAVSDREKTKPRSL